ncbi:PASTA domain-containing protein, partial [Ilumatobacter sp.]|uniref:PASTA domain-containing protein n=1 Tax=Ilumatobacter sp. TaxID=1967498 RepID=UPI003C671568
GGGIGAASHPDSPEPSEAELTPSPEEPESDVVDESASPVDVPAADSESDVVDESDVPVDVPRVDSESDVVEESDVPVDVPTVDSESDVVDGSDSADVEPAPEQEPDAEDEQEPDAEDDQEADGAADAATVATAVIAADVVEAAAVDEPAADDDSEPELNADESETDAAARSELDPESDVKPDSDSDDADDSDADATTVPTAVTTAEPADSSTDPEHTDAPEDPALADLHAELDASPVATAVMPITDTAPDRTAPAGGELYDDAPSRRRKGPIIAMVLLLLVGLGALAYAGSLLLQTKSFTVPVLAGVSEAEALNQISGNGWELETVRERSDSFPEPDTVIRTAPGAGVELDEGEPFTLVLSDGPEFRSLPELDELPFNAAVTELADLGLIGIEGDDREFSETVPAEAVIVWQVQGDADGGMRAGAQILPGETIVMTLSKGPEPRVIPDLTTGTGPEGRTTIEGMQLEYVREDDVFSDTVPSGQVVSQTPAAGESLERGGTVTVRVSKGPDVVEFPDLDGLEFTAAQDLLVKTGFTVGSLLGTTEGTFVEATIDDEDVPVGEVLPRGTAIDLIFL